jgi:putative GTP pyrophosphokinase
MSQVKLTKTDNKRIDEMVSLFEANKHIFDSLVYQLTGHVQSSIVLKPVVHSIKSRVKDPSHLREKLERKWIRAKASGQDFPHNKENLFRTINDLAGLRILHLHTRQIEIIHKALIDIFEEQRFVLLEPPSARTWDDESRELFAQFGIDTVNSGSMYTSVHYVVQPNSKSDASCEIQVRTLSEEVWGEVDHKINYPTKSPSASCREQIKVLARMTSSCSRLVDSIFLSSDLDGATHTSPGRKASKTGRGRGPAG